MSNLIINIRILMWHIQVTEEWKFELVYNEAHKRLSYGLFEIYEFKPFNKNANN